MKKIFIGLIIFLVLAVVTNPNEKKHKEAVKREINTMLEAEVGRIGGVLSKEQKLKAKALNLFIERENNYVFSKTKLKVFGEEKIIGYGFFGFVFINRSALKN